MRSTKGVLAPYKPEQVPADLPPNAQRYLDTELNRISAVLQGLLLAPQTAAPAEPRKWLLLEVSTAPPPEPIMPMLVFADGVNWDPGSGAGFYYWNESVWTPLG